MPASLANWMAHLPPEMTDRPIHSLKIPGSHDSGATKSLSLKLPVANDESAPIRQLGRAPCIRRGIKRWAVTQSYSVRQQLDLGIRYFDLRVSYPPLKIRDSSTDFRLVHALYGPKLKDVFEQILDFLTVNTREIIVLDMNHLYDFDTQAYNLLHDETIKSLGRSLFCPINPPSRISLDFMWRNGYRFIVFCCYTNESALFWPSYLIPSPWPDTNKVDILLRILESDLEIRCDDPDRQGFFVSQGVLTPKNYDVVSKWFSSLRSALSQRATERVLQWLADLDKTKREKVNVVILDFVDEESSSYIISLNGIHLNSASSS
ncbi:hypothetical protein RB195_001308 [Necator americanus]